MSAQDNNMLKERMPHQQGAIEPELYPEATTRQMGRGRTRKGINYLRSDAIPHNFRQRRLAKPSNGPLRPTCTA